MKMKNLHYLLMVLLGTITALKTNAQISGTVYQDFNGNGVRDNIPATATTAPIVDFPTIGIIVRAYNSSEVLIASQTTSIAGTYTFPVGSGLNQIPLNTQVRLEFILPENCVMGNKFFSNGVGANLYGSNVQFKTQLASVVNADYAIQNPLDYRSLNNNPKILVPNLTVGDPIALVPASSNPASVGSAL